MDIKKGILKIRVKTGAARSRVLGWEKGILKIAVKAQPERGKANLEVVKLFKKEFNKEIKFLSGLKSKNKLIEVF